MAIAKILIVEDEGLVAQDIRHRLIQMGYPSPEIASTGEDAVEIAARVYPDLILMDIILSKGYLDGVEAAEQIRKFLNVPIIYLTASSDAVTLSRAKSTEPNGYILKPFQTRELQIAIELTLYKYKVEQEVQEQDRLLFETLKGMDDGVIASDEFGIIFFMNPSAEKLTGWLELDALGRHLGEVVDINAVQSKEEADHPNLLELNLNHKIPSHGQLVAKNGMGTEVITASKSVVQTSGSEQIGNVLMIRKFKNHK